METASVIPHVNQVLKFENLFSSSLNKPKCLLLPRFPQLAFPESAVRFEIYPFWLAPVLLAKNKNSL